VTSTPLERVLAVTGGTGFVGSTTIRIAIEAGWRVKALTRAPQKPTQTVHWISGHLGCPDALRALVSGSDAVLHIAGVTNTPSREGFAKGNIEGSAAVVQAAREAGVKRLIHVSSLSVREPRLSDYGWSKAEAEKVVMSSDLDWTVIRPPAIYGPGDIDHLDLFKSARLGIIPLPPRGKMSEIEVSDLARLLIAAASDTDSIGALYEADDGKTGGWTHEGFARAIGEAMGKRILPLHVPAFIVRLAAKADRILRGDKAKLTPDRAAYFCHPDWVIDPAKRPPPALWTPQVDAAQGLAATAAAYRTAGWL
jgi:uncharacterized protein YbjT (DUF2867 family)